MKKSMRIVKKILALLIIFTLNINAYATQSSNDGSAFITKAEFDSLVEKFRQIEYDYIENLNAKIDNAVANYIGGLSGVASANAIMYINSIQSSNVMKFTVWSDPGSTLTGRYISASGGVGFQQHGQGLGWAASFNTSNSTASTTNNKSRWYIKDFMGQSCYMGTCYPYIRTTWTLQGIAYATNNAEDQMKFGTSVSRVTMTRTAPNTTTTTTTRQQYWLSASSVGWTSKYGYLTHGQTWARVANDATDYYSIAANALSTSSANFVRDELRDTDDGMECTSGNRYSISVNGTNALCVGSYSRTMTWVESSLPYWTVKTDSLAWTSLYNYIMVAKGFDLKLYEGVPFFKATLTGNATIKMQVVGGSTDITFVDLCISKNKFSNAVISSGNKMTSIYPAYDKSKASPTAETLKNVNIARVKSGDIVTIVMPVTLDDTYYVKLMPRTSATSTATPAAGKYAYIARNMQTIKIEAPQEKAK